MSISTKEKPGIFGYESQFITLTSSPWAVSGAQLAWRCIFKPTFWWCWRIFTS